MKFAHWLLLIIMLSPAITRCQVLELDGNVIDSISKTPIAFASIKVQGTNIGTVSDIDGRFLLKNVRSASTLTISCVGYATKTIQIGERSIHLEISVSPLSNQLENVVISGGENPAHRIIRLAQQHVKQNDPEQLSSFTYHAYTVAALGAGNSFWKLNTTDPSSNRNSKTSAGKPRERDTTGDHLARQVIKGFMENYLMLTESYTERKFRYPGQSKETVIATKISGLKNAPVAFTTSNFQPFGFYKESIEMLNKQYINPLVLNSLSLYSFKMKETNVRGTDTTFVIAFEPKKRTNFPGLKGILYINSYRYAIENVVATAADDKGTILRFKLQQKYTRNGTFWFPEQLNTTITQVNGKTDSALLFWDTRSYIDRVSINEPIQSKQFSDIYLDYSPEAGKRSESDWSTFRKDSLKEKEKNSYATYQLLPAKALNQFNKVNQLVEAITLEAIPVGKIDLPFKYMLSGINAYEKFRLGGGLQTNQLLSKAFSAGAFIGYGIGDKAFKYGANLQLLLHERTATKITAAYASDLAEPGSIGFLNRNSAALSNQTLRNFAASRMDSVEQLRIEIQTNLKPHLITYYWLQHERRSAAGYHYAFKFNENQDPQRLFLNTEAGIGLRFTVGERYSKIGRAKVLSRQGKTEMMVQLTKGFNSIAGGQLDYTNVSLQFNHEFKLLRLGDLAVQIDAGKIWGSVPYYYLFNTRAIKSERKLLLFIPNLFQTASLYEFVADQSASVFLRHNFGNLLFKPRHLNWRPELLLLHSMSIGQLQHPGKHLGIQAKAPVNGLLESGIMVQNLLRNNMKIAYFGIGAGIFYRYGYYQLPKAADNWAFKVGFTVSF